jgi:hypothetical protein
MRYAVYILLLLAVVVLAATFTMQPVMGATQSNGMTGMPMMQNCPMQIPGATVSIQDTNDGIALTITTQSGDDADLQRQAESMVKMHSNQGMHGNMMPFTVTSEQITKGARLTLKPKDPGKLEEFRSTVRRHAEQMKNHDCSMMQGMMQGMMGHKAHHPGGEK